MPNLTEIIEEINSARNQFDTVRRKYLVELFEVTGRNTILYYSGWLQNEHLLRQGISGFNLADGDKDGFMSAIHKMDKSLGLDLLLHTPGGDISATESLVDYLHSVFDGNIRAIVPQIAMSAGTMVALSCNSVVMGKHSSLGAIDPQINGLPAHGVVEEFDAARKDIAAGSPMTAFWQVAIGKYSPTIEGESRKAIDWADAMAHKWLVKGMLKDDSEASEKAAKIVEEFGNHAVTLSHSRHISATKAADIGVKVELLEDDQKLQEAVLSVHHATLATFNGTDAIKLIESQTGSRHVVRYSPN